MRWGWHQLADRWARRLVDDAGVRPGDLVVDVGAGTGAITRHLVERGARVIAVELHPARAAALRTAFARDDVVVVRADAADLRLPRRPFSVVANPPFSVTTALLGRLLHQRSHLLSADLVVPRHTAARWAGGRGRDARRWSASYEARMGRGVPRSAFHPPPPAEVAVLTLRRRSPTR
jgi:23S rRNA (adenine-N6)-dimethyltransferase